MNETTDLKKALEKAADKVGNRDLTKTTSQKNELESFFQSTAPLMKEIWEQFLPKKEPEIFISSKKQDECTYKALHAVFEACTGKKVDVEGFINGIAFAFSMVPVETEKKEKV